MNFIRLVFISGLALILVACGGVSKDSDFFKYNLIHGRPKRILMITTENITNVELIRLFKNN